MSHRSRLLAAVLLVAALAVPAALQASTLPTLPLRTAAHDGGILLPTSSWSLDGLLRMIRQVWIDNGSTHDPSAGTNAAPPPGNSGDNGGILDPSGRANAPGRHVTAHRRHGH